MSSAQPTFGFDPERLYRPQDEQMRQIASVGQLSQWRFHKRGLPFIQHRQKCVLLGARSHPNT